jgi:hypothetical protein
VIKIGLVKIIKKNLKTHLSAWNDGGYVAMSFPAGFEVTAVCWS